ncbi:MAG: helix-turn-helix transcriptional regulator [Solirubrobacteraceae bacterium]
MTAATLGQVLKDARTQAGLSLRGVEARTGIHNAHLSQIENNVIIKPEMAMLWELAALYGLQYSELLRLAGHSSASEPSKRATQRMTVALRALGEMSARDQDEVLQYMADLRKRRASD